MTLLVLEQLPYCVVGLSDRRVIAADSAAEGPQFCDHRGKVEPETTKTVALADGILAIAGNHRNAEAFRDSSKGLPWETVVGNYSRAAREFGKRSISLALGIYTGPGLRAVSIVPLDNGRRVRLSYDRYSERLQRAVGGPEKDHLAMFFGPGDVLGFLGEAGYAQVVVGCGREHKYDPFVSAKAPRTGELSSAEATVAALLRFGGAVSEACAGVGNRFDVSFLTREGAKVMPEDFAPGYARYVDLLNSRE